MRSPSPKSTPSPQPANCASFPAPASITLEAFASDYDGTVTNVEFFAGTNKLGATATGPYRLTWTGVPLGHYFLKAAATDNGGARSFSRPVEVFVYGPAGSLAGTVSTPPFQVDLTSEGTADWAHWGLSSADSFDRKGNVPQQINGVVLQGTNILQNYSDNLTSFAWSDGTPTPLVGGTTTGIFITGATNGFQLTAPADANPRRLRVYVGGYGVQGFFQARLSDLSGPAFSDTSVSNVYGSSYVVYTLDYTAAAPGQALVVVYRPADLFDVLYGNVTLQAATLQGGPSDPLPVRILNLWKDGCACSFGFASRSDHSYAVQYTPSLSPTNWQTFTNLPGTGAMISVTNHDVTDSQRFYRVLTL